MRGSGCSVVSARNASPAPTTAKIAQPATVELPRPQQRRAVRRRADEERRRVEQRLGEQHRQRRPLAPLDGVAHERHHQRKAERAGVDADDAPPHEVAVQDEHHRRRADDAPAERAPEREALPDEDGAEHEREDLGDPERVREQRADPVDRLDARRVVDVGEVDQQVIGEQPGAVIAPRPERARARVPLEVVRVGDAEELQAKEPQRPRRGGDEEGELGPTCDAFAPRGAHG